MKYWIYLLAGVLINCYTVSALAIPIEANAFTVNASVEDFEGILGNTVSPVNSSQGVGQIGAPFHFDSGVELSYAYTTVLDQVWGTGSWGGPQLIDFAVGTAGYGLGQRGAISEPSNISSGTAFLSRPGGTWTFTFDDDISMFGVYLTTAYVEDRVVNAYESNGVVDIAAFTDAGLFIESFQTQMTDAFSGNLDFIGFHSDVPFNTITMSGDYLVIDDLTFESAQVSTAVPEPSTIILMSTGLLCLFGSKRNPNNS